MNRFAALVAFALCLIPLSAHAADRVSVTQYGIIVETLPWAIALEKGLLKKQGLDIDGFIGSTGGGTTVRNMMASGMPFAEMAVPAAIAAIQSGVDMKIVYGAVNNMGDLAWLVRKDSPIKKMSDLKGKKVGFTQPKSTTEMVLRMILQSQKLTNDVTVLPTGGIGAGVVALDQGAIDAAPVEEPLLLKDADKYRVLFRVNDFLPNLTWSVGVTTPDFLKSHPEVVHKLVQARREAVDYMYAHPAEAEQVYAKVWNSNDRTIEDILPRLIKSKYWSRNDINMAGLETMLQGMQLVGALDKPLDPKTLIDGSFLR
ncbi:MAG TPA: ABC transporter substrate-binding protein [Candidatus Binatia bacterium]|nr:ABC transporter substrate-binding protein [Candidatus Binatia bacterium]